MALARSLETAELDRAQLRVLESLTRSELAEDFVLTGGTALAAFFFQHRTSDDIDLFSEADVPLDAVNNFLQSVPGLRVDSYERRYDRKLFSVSIDGAPLKVEFTKFPYPRVCGKVQVAPGLWVDSPNEILINKLLAMTDRREPKDDIDVFFLLQSEQALTLVEATQLVERKFGISGLRYSLQSRLLAVPSELPSTTPPVTRAEVVARFREGVQSLIATFAAK